MSIQGVKAHFFKLTHLGFSGLKKLLFLGFLKINKFFFLF